MVNKILVLIFFAATFLCLVYFSMHGFDVTDEGSYLLSSRHPEDVLLSVSAYQHLFAPLFKAIGYQMIVWRWFCVAGIGLSGIYLGRETAGLLRKFDPEDNSFLSPWVCMAFTGLGALLFFSRGGLFTPSYNSLMAMAINISAAIFIKYFRLMLEVTFEKRKALLLLLLQGFIIGLSLFVKIPCGLSLLFFWLIIVLFLNPEKANVFVPFVALLSGLGLNILWYFLLIQNYHGWISMFLNALHTLSLEGHDPHGLWVMYLNDIKSNFYAIGSKFLPIIALVLGITVLEEILRPRTQRFLKIVSYLFVALLLLILIEFILNGYHIGGGNAIFSIFQVYLFWMALCLSAICVISLIRIFKHQEGLFGHQAKTKALILIGLIAFPFLGTVGTNNPLTVNIMMNLAPWFACFLVIFRCVLKGNAWGRWSMFIVLIISFFASSQIISASVLSPYRLNAGILKQNVMVSLGDPVSQVFLDQDTAAFFVKMKSIASSCAFKPGEDILAFSDMPGIVYALGGRSAGTSWWYSFPYSGVSSKQCRIYTNYILQLIPIDRVQKAYILEKVSKLTVRPDLKNRGVDFPQGYYFCGEARWPLDHEVIQLWKPK
jgi:hypothetical protein